VTDFKHKAHFKNVRAENLTESKKALWCVIDGEKHCIPLSQIDDASSVWGEGDEGELVISERLAIEMLLV
jgi:hypothetical protein